VGAFQRDVTRESGATIDDRTSDRAKPSHDPYIAEVVQTSV
jgi:hypothetical protein